MEHTRDHIIFFMAQKMYLLERRAAARYSTGWWSTSSRSTSTGLLEFLTRYYAVDVEREMDDFYLAEGELVFVSRRGSNRFKHVYRDGRLRLVGIEGPLAAPSSWA